MPIGIIDLQDFDYLIVYKDEDGNVNTWSLPESSFQINYKSMLERGCVLRVYKKMSDKDLKEIVD